MDAGSYNLNYKEPTSTLDDYIKNRYKDDKNGRAQKAQNLITTDAIGYTKLGGVDIGQSIHPSDGSFSTQYKKSDLDRAFDAFDKQQDTFDAVKNKTYQPTSVKQKSNANQYTYGNVNDNVVNKSNSLWDYIYGQDPYETSAGKNIMKEYNIKGQFAKDGAIASGAAANSGNIDSYAAANALKQQAAYASLGNQAVLDYHNSTISNLKDVIGILQGQSDRMYNQDIDEKLKIAEITGYVPNEWATRTNPYFNSDGTLISPEKDYYAEQIALENKLKQTTDPTEREDLIREINDVKAARFYKVNNIPGFEQYKETVSAPSPAKTNSRTTIDNNFSIAQQEIATNAQLAKDEIAAQQAMQSEKLAHDKEQTAQDRELEAWKTRFNAEQQIILNQLEHENQKELMSYDRQTQLDVIDRTGYYNQIGLETKYAYDLAASQATGKKLDNSTAKYIATHEGDFSPEVINDAKLALGVELYESYKAGAVDETGKLTEKTAIEIAENESYYTDEQKADAKELLGENRYAHYKNEADLKRKENGTTVQSNDVYYYDFSGESEKIDSEKKKAVDMDWLGERFTKAIIAEAKAKGGSLDSEELLRFVVNNSNAYNINLNQLRKVYNYLNLDTTVLDRLEDVNTEDKQNGWKEGVKFIAS